MNPKTIRDLSIDAAIHAILRLKEPTISNADIQRRACTEVFNDGYIVHLDDAPVVIVELTGDASFKMLLLTH